MSESSKTCWIITEGIAGTENPCIGLAEAIGIPFIVKRVTLRPLWRLLSPWLALGHAHAPATGSDPVTPPYPDLLITSGRKAVGIGRHIKKKSAGRTFHVHVQDPRVGLKCFDAVVVSQHDPARGDNVILIKAGLHRLTPAALDDARAHVAPRFSTLPAPRVAVLIGGNSRAHRMTTEVTERLAADLGRLAAQGASLMITASRRTGEANAAYLRDKLQGPGVFFWDGRGDNPYTGILGWADYIIVTEDSVSMTSEALSTGKPVYVAPLEGGKRRLDLFHKMLMEQGYTRPFTGTLEQWSYTPPNDTQTVADEILRRMREKNV